MFDPSKFENYPKFDPANPSDFYMIRELSFPTHLTYSREDILAFYRDHNISDPTINDYREAVHYLTKKQEDEWNRNHPPVEYDIDEEDDMEF